MTWDLSLKQETPIAIRASTPPYGRWRIGYDPGGKDPTVFAAKADTPGIVNWKVGFLQGKGYTIQAAGGPLAGWYLTPGTENIEMDVRGKNTVVGTKPVLSKEPAYFEIDEIGP